MHECEARLISGRVLRKLATSFGAEEHEEDFVHLMFFFSRRIFLPQSRMECKNITGTRGQTPYAVTHDMSPMQNNVIVPINRCTLLHGSPPPHLWCFVVTFVCVNRFTSIRYFLLFNLTSIHVCCDLCVCTRFMRARKVVNSEPKQSHATRKREYVLKIKICVSTQCKQTLMYIRYTNTYICYTFVPGCVLDLIRELNLLANTFRKRPSLAPIRHPFPHCVGQ